MGWTHLPLLLLLLLFDCLTVLLLLLLCSTLCCCCCWLLRCSNLPLARGQRSSSAQEVEEEVGRLGARCVCGLEEWVGGGVELVWVDVPEDLLHEAPPVLLWSGRGLVVDVVNNQLWP